jgi:hypothetical protein
MVAMVAAIDVPSRAHERPACVQGVVQAAGEIRRDRFAAIFDLAQVSLAVVRESRKLGQGHFPEGPPLSQLGTECALVMLSCPVAHPENPDPFPQETQVAYGK